MGQQLFIRGPSPACGVWYAGPGMWRVMPIAEAASPCTRQLTGNSSSGSLGGLCVLLWFADDGTETAYFSHPGDFMDFPRSGSFRASMLNSTWSPDAYRVPKISSKNTLTIPTSGREMRMVLLSLIDDYHDMVIVFDGAWSCYMMTITLISHPGFPS